MVRKLKFLVLAAEVSDDKFKMKVVVVVAAAEDANEKVELYWLSEPEPADAL